MKAAEISNHINTESAWKKKKAGPALLNASNISHPCERYLYFMLRYKNAGNAKSKSITDISGLETAVEGYALARLRESGIDIRKKPEHVWSIDYPYIRGYAEIDIMEDPGGEPIPADIKCLNPCDWQDICTAKDFYGIGRYYMQAYPVRLLLYMWIKKKRNGILILANKLTGGLKAVDVTMDNARVTEILDKAERIYNAVALGEALDKTRYGSLCEKCAYREMCR